MEVAPSNWNFSCDFEINFGSSENASIAYSVLAVDKELQPDKVRREMSVSDGKIFVHFEAVEARFLRASFSSLCDLMGLEGIKSYGIDKLIKVAATQLSDQLPESREAARTLSLELQGFYCKLENEDPSVQLESNPDPTCQSKLSWEEFCHAKLSPLSAQAILRVTTSSQKETLVADC